MRHVTQTGIDFIKQFEGYSATSYVCPAGYPTIGYGHAIRADEHFDGGIDKQQAEILLCRDVQVVERAVLRLIDVPLTDGQFAALVSFTFIYGLAGIASVF